MIGYMITGNSDGILFLQVVFMFFTLLAIYSICRNDRYWLMIVSASLFTIAFIAGMMLLLCPFIIYFGIKGQLYELYFGTIGFNLLYQKKMPAWIRGADAHTWLHFMVVYVAYFSVFLSAILAFFIHEYRLMGYCIMLAVVETWLFMGGAGYSQYGIIAIPNITLFLGLLLDVGRRHAKWFQRLTVVLLCAYLLFTGGRMSNRIIENMAQQNDSSADAIDELMSHIPETDRDFFIAYGDDTLKSVYLKYNIDPCYPYFAIQEWHAEFSEAVREDIHRVFKSRKAKWILTGEDTEGIQDILDDWYILEAKIKGYNLYIRNSNGKVK